VFAIYLLILATVATAACGAADLLPGVVTGIAMTIFVAMSLVVYMVHAMRPCPRCGEPKVRLLGASRVVPPCAKCGYTDGD
jgi:hypothetical protein